MRPAISPATPPEEEGKKKLTRRELRQRKAQERAEMLKRKRLTQEIELGALNTKRYRTLWREMVARIRMPQIVEDVEVAWRNFERALDIKDYRISFLMDELDEAEEQYQKNLRSHTETVDRLLRMYADRMDREESNYRKMLNDALDCKDNETIDIHQQENEDEILIQSTNLGIDQQLEDTLNNIKSVALSKIDAFVEDNKDVRRIAATVYENQLRSIWEDLRRVLSNYQNKTEDRRKYYEALKEKDEIDQQTIVQQSLRIINLFEEIRKFRNKIIDYDAVAKKDISEILSEHDFFQKAYWAAKNRFLSEQMKDKNQLRILSIEYNKTIKYLEHLVKKGKRLLTLMEICYKYEALQDCKKVIPIIDCTKNLQLDSPSSHQPVSPEWNVSRQIMEDFQDLTWFWQRIGSEQVNITQLQSEKDRLKIQSDELRECLKIYMKGENLRADLLQSKSTQRFVSQCYLRQHLIACEECNYAKTKKVSQSNKHVKLQPEDTE